MSKKKALLAAGAAVALSAPLAQKAEAAANTANLQARAIVIQAISMSATQTLHFGSFSVSAANGRVDVSTGGARAQGVVGINLVTGAGLEEEGSINVVSGASGINLTWSVPAMPVVLTHSTAGTQVLNLTQLTFGGILNNTATGGNVVLTTGSLSDVATFGATTGAIPVGGRLVTPAAARTAGTYSGSVIVTASYN